MARRVSSALASAMVTFQASRSAMGFQTESPTVFRTVVGTANFFSFDVGRGVEDFFGVGVGVGDFFLAATALFFFRGLGVGVGVEKTFFSAAPRDCSAAGAGTIVETIRASAIKILINMPMV